MAGYVMNGPVGNNTVVNLNADLLDGNHASAFAPSGFGLGTQAQILNSGTDLNTIRNTGFYKINAAVNAPPRVSGDNPSIWHYVIVTSHDTGSWCSQVAIEYSTGTVFSRVQNSGTWQAWVRQWSTTADTLSTSGGISVGGDITLPNASSIILSKGTAESLASSTPTGLTYGKLQGWGDITIAADTDNGGTEHVILAAGHGVTPATTDGLAVGQSTLQWKGNDVIHSGGGQTINGTLTATTFSGALSGNSTTATNISNTGTVTLATATESNAITVTAPSYSTDQPVKLLNFNWYSDTWSLGNIRSGSTASNGFGVYFNGAEQARFTNGTFKVTGALSLTGTVTNNMSSGSVFLKHNVSEADSWIFQEYANDWGIIYHNDGTNTQAVFGSYTTGGFETIGTKSGTATNAVSLNLNGFHGVDSNTYATWMLSHNTGQFWNAGNIESMGNITAHGTIYAGGNTSTGSLTIRNSGQNVLGLASMQLSSASGTDFTLLNTKQIRFSDGTAWDYNAWAGIGYDSANHVLHIGGPQGSWFNSNTSPPAITMSFDGMTSFSQGATTFASQSDGSMRVSNSNGYVDIAPKDTGYAHIYTDRPAFYFNAPLEVSGNTVWHQGNLGSPFNKVSMNGGFSYDANVDLNTLTTVGEARFLQQSVVNGPSGASGMLYYYGLAGGDVSNRGVQLLASTSDFWWRERSVNAWRKIWHDGNFNPINFANVAVSGQAEVSATIANDTLTLAAGSNITLTTSGKTVTIASTASGGGGTSNYNPLTTPSAWLLH